jgi:phage terminase large subunit GpA-like protein
VTDPETREVVLCTSSQVAKTTFIIIVALYYASNDPWNMFHIMPTEDEASEVKAERYIPIIRESPDLSRFLVGKGKGQLTGDVIRINGCTITFRGSHSASGLASKPAKIAVADEIDKWDDWTGKEADPLDLLGERMKTFHDSKFIKCSTPTTKNGRIYNELLSSTNERYQVPCPLCGAYQELVFGDGGVGSPGLKWPKGVSADRIDHENLAWYECAHCSRRIDEKLKRQMVMNGVWSPYGLSVSDSGEIEGERPAMRKAGYHLWAGYTLWPGASWSKIAAQFLKSKDSSRSLMNFRNSWLAEVWRVTLNELGEKHIRACEQPYKGGSAPNGAWSLTVGVDVQRTGEQVYQYYTIRAWGAEGESWLVREGTTADWSHLYGVLFDSVYRDQSGNQLAIEVVIIDAGFETDQVYQFCDTYGCWASKGDARTRQPYKVSETESVQGSGRWLRRVNVNPDYYKGQVHNLIHAGKWHIHEDMPEEYFKQMTAEQVVSEVDKRTGRTRYHWKIISSGRANHYFDCEVLALCGAEMLELRYRKKKEQPAERRNVETPPMQRIVSKVFT